jgi:Uma2 family endonuclease
MQQLRIEDRITVDDFHRMAETGRLRDDERVELLNGRLITVPTPSPPHAGSTNALFAVLLRALGDRAHIGSQSPVVLDEWSEPHPDIVVSRPNADRYMTRHPTPADVLLLAEVSRSALRFDRGEKLAAYARCAIREVWIVDLVRFRLETFSEPAGERYAVRNVYARQDTVAPRAFPDDRIAVASFMPPPRLRSRPR